MTKEELAAKLDGREYRQEITKKEAAEAQAAGLAVVFGASDDLMEFRGAIYDEVGCYDGGTAYLGRNDQGSVDLLQNDCNDDACPHFTRAKAAAPTIEAKWCVEPGLSWTYETTIPHATFEVKEHGGTYCRGIVFAVADVPLSAPAA